MGVVEMVFIGDSRLNGELLEIFVCFDNFFL